MDYKKLADEARERAGRSKQIGPPYHDYYFFRDVAVAIDALLTERDTLQEEIKGNYIDEYL